MYSLFSLIRSGNRTEAIIFILSGCFVVFCCTPLHELAHGWVAYKLGDNTAKNQGRLTFNPIAHIDPIGMAMILLFGFGYAKAVPVNMRNFKKPKRDMALVGLAGPCANLVLAFVSIFVCYLIAYLLHPNTFTSILVNFFYYSAFINVSLAAFNLIPIPPLDGSKIIAGVLPDKAYYKYMMYERYAMIALIVILFTGILDKFLGVVAGALMNFISIIPVLIFGNIIY